MGNERLLAATREAYGTYGRKPYTRKTKPLDEEIIRATYFKTGITQQELANIYGVGRTTITRIIGKTGK